MELQGRYSFEDNKIILSMGNLIFGCYNLTELENKMKSIADRETVGITIGLEETISLDEPLIDVMLTNGFEIMTAYVYVSGFRKYYSTSQKSTNLDS